MNNDFLTTEERNLLTEMLVNSNTEILQKQWKIKPSTIMNLISSNEISNSQFRNDFLNYQTFGFIFSLLIFNAYDKIHMTDTKESNLYHKMNEYQELTDIATNLCGLQELYSKNSLDILQELNSKTSFNIAHISKISKEIFRDTKPNAKEIGLICEIKKYTMLKCLNDIITKWEQTPKQYAHLQTIFEDFEKTYK